MVKRADPKLIGLFVVGAIALGVAAVMIIGSRRLFRRTYEYVLFFSGNVGGLRVGAPVKFKGVEIGTVAEILLSLNQRQGPQGSREIGIPPDIKIPVIIALEEKRLRSRGARGLGLADPKFVRAAIRQGLRAQLATESILTGMLYVDLDMHPGTPANLVLSAGQAPYQEIPTLPTAFEEAQSAAARVIAGLDRVDFPKLVASINQTLDAIKNIAASPELKQAAGNLNRTAATLNRTATSIRIVADQMSGQIGPLGQELRTNSENVNVALLQVRTTLEALQTSLGPESPLMYQSGETLARVAAAARSLKELTDYLQRNPSALVRGRALEQDQQ